MKRGCLISLNMLKQKLSPGTLKHEVVDTAYKKLGEMLSIYQRLSLQTKLKTPRLMALQAKIISADSRKEGSYCFYQARAPDKSNSSSRPIVAQGYLKLPADFRF